jgi:ElaB/YqjD/DUF883 family membrane-anchored ribosome-binding protein
MAERAGNIPEELKAIDRTRASMTHTLEMLEERVQETIEDARESVAEVVDRAQTAAEDVVDRVEDFVDRARLAVDPRHQMQQHPWAMLAGAVAVGYLLSQMESRGSSAPRALGAEGAATARGRTIRMAPNVWDSVSYRLEDEIDHLKGAAVTAAESFLRDLFQQIVPAVLAPLARETRRRTRAGEFGEQPDGQGC